MFAIVIFAAVLIQLGREAFPLINDYRENISRYLGDQIGMKISVEKVSATWSGLKPKIDLQGVMVKSTASITVFKIDRASLELGIVESILERRVFWRKLKFDGFDSSFVQTSEGDWAILGLPEDLFNKSKKESNQFDIDDPLDVFLFGRRVEINDARFSIYFRSGEQSKVLIPKIALENDRDFHRLSAGLELDGDAKAFSLIVEGHGDPRNDDFHADGYIGLNGFPITRVIDAFGIDAVESSAPPTPEDIATLDVKLWFTRTQDQGFTLTGDLSAQNIPSDLNPKLKLPSDISADLSGRWRAGEGWSLGLGELLVQWPEYALPAINVGVSGGVAKPYQFSVDTLDAEAWSTALLKAEIDNVELNKALAGLKPKGTINNVQMTLTDKASGYFSAVANVVGGQVDAYMGAPALNNVNGYVRSTLNRGTFDLHTTDGISLFLPKVYHEPITFDEAQGQIGWEVEFKNKWAYITSGLLRVKNDGESANGYLSLDLPFSRKVGEAKMTLNLGLSETMAKYHKRYIPKVVPASLYEWLDTSIQGGQVSDVRFLYHGSLEKNPVVQPTLQLSGYVKGGTIAFDPNWPQLEDVSGALVVNNNSLDVDIERATLLGNTIHDTHVSLVGPISAPALSIKGEVEGDVNSAMRLLKNSPIKDNIGNTFDAWVMSGGVRAKADFIIPLDNDNSRASQKIDAHFERASINIPELNLTFEDIGGVLHYDNENEIYADNLSGKLWGESFRSSIESRPVANSGSDTVIHFTGPVKAEDLQQWTDLSELRFVSGKSDVVGKLEIPQSGDRPIEISFSSRLTGSEIHLPQPLGKTKDSAVDLSGVFKFYAAKEEYFLTVSDTLRLTMGFDENEIASTKIELFNFDPQKHGDIDALKHGSIEVLGNVGFADLEKWLDVKDQYFVYETERLNGVEEGVSDIPVFVDLAMDIFSIGDLEIEGLDVKGERVAPVWHLDVDSELMSGNVIVPEDERPIALDLKYLRLVDDEATANVPSAQSGQTSDSATPSIADNEGEAAPALGVVDEVEAFESALADIDLRKAVALNLKTQEFSIDQENYGSWAFKLRPIAGGIVAHDIRANVRDVQIGSEEIGAEFVWLQNYDDEGPTTQSSQFSGAVSAEDLATVFAAWGQEELIKSKSANMDIDAQWQGAPDEVTLQNIKGAIRLGITKGSFSRGAGSDENALLRLIALLNFDTIVRRLRLDFSDLAAQGFAYDSISGNLEFEDGNIYLKDPLIVDSSSSYIQVAGTLNAIEEDLDAQMVVTLPVASNVAVATALIVNIPAGLGLYLMSKLFKKQVDRASSINVEVSGAWQDPKIKVKKIFDINAANRKGMELKRDGDVEVNLDERLPNEVDGVSGPEINTDLPGSDTAPREHTAR